MDDGINKSRVLALAMRPSDFSEVVGHADVVAQLRNQLDCGRVPHFIIFSGPVGCGKTTFAKILSRMIHERSVLGSGPAATAGANKSMTMVAPEVMQTVIKRNTREINAANHTGIDDARHLIRDMKFFPMAPGKAKVVVLDEAHQLSAAAQNALITETEDVADHVYYIFCTSNVSKIIPALRRRAYLVALRTLEDEGELRELVRRAARHAGYDEHRACRDQKGVPEEEDASMVPSTRSVERLVRALADYDVTSPGLVLQAAEKFFGGATDLQSVCSTSGTPVTGGGPNAGNVDTLQICRAIAGGRWKACAEQVQKMSRADVWPIKHSALGYLKTILLKSTGQRALNCAKAMRYLSDTTHSGGGDDDVPSFMAALCMACSQMAAQSTSAATTNA